MKHQNLSKKISLAGINSSLIIMSLFFSSLLPTNKLLFLTLSSVLLAIIVIEINTFFAFLVYIGTSIFGFLLVNNKVIMLLYILFFGYYCIIKYYIEKINNIIFEWILKFIYFNMIFILLYYLSIKLLFSNIIVKINQYVLLLVIQIVFVVYDYSISLILHYYNHRIRKMLKF